MLREEPYLTLDDLHTRTKLARITNAGPKDFVCG